ncbi:MAG: phosphoribosylformylglycinamidine synthase II, partial [Alphaproteobacteria bacterium]|nr:phosphoribosylformylglycinamidine synthase II [Alphaproteobacteria bacterium]
TDDRRLRWNMYGRTWCDMPVPPLVDDAPLYDRPQGDYPVAQAITAPALPAGMSNGDALKTLIACPDSASKRWVWEQYDSLVSGNTIAAPGQADAALVKLPGADKTLAITSDCTPRYCQADPFEGGKQAVAESYRNICATGATPLAVTNNLNFGNPEKPQIMRQFAECLRGMGEACRELDYPVISGNVSLYNETGDRGIMPTPVIGGVGVIADWRNARGLAFKAVEQDIVLIGTITGHVGQSLYLREIHGREDGTPPAVDLATERKHGTFIRKVIAENHVTACHDVADGGVLLTVAEMAIASGIGAKLAPQDTAFWFGEDQACYVVTTTDSAALLLEAEKAGVPAVVLGQTITEMLQIGAETGISVYELRLMNEKWLPAYMNGEA